MNEYDKNIDQLIHDLLKSGMETPSPDLSARIMQRIAQEIPVLKKAYLLRPVSFPNFMHLFRWGVAGYVGIAVFIIFVLLNTSTSETMTYIWDSYKEMIILVLIIVSIISSIFFYSALDRMLFPNRN
ncbi:MAG: hypothetical protein LIP06_14050 [Tannerellaceae bacterium]|nr:hypothetical protein [Tannerellaceae bacterium]